jgi:hypothetical protein
MLLPTEPKKNPEHQPAAAPDVPLVPGLLRKSDRIVVAQIVYILALVACSLYHSAVELLTFVVYIIKHRPSLATDPKA